MERDKRNGIPDPNAKEKSNLTFSGMESEERRFTRA